MEHDGLEFSYDERSSMAASNVTMDTRSGGAYGPPTLAPPCSQVLPSPSVLPSSCSKGGEPLMPCANNAQGKFVDTVRNTLAAVPRGDGNALGCIADAILSLADGFSNDLAVSAADVKAELKADFAAVKGAHSVLAARVEAVEKKAEKFAEDSDLTAAAVTLAMRCDPYELVFSNVPFIADDLLVDALIVLGGSMDIKFSPNCVIEFRKSAPPMSYSAVAADGASASGCPAAPTASASRLQGQDIFVKFRYAKLRDSFLSRMRKTKGAVLLYPGVPADTRIRCYEVLLSDRHTLFKDIRARADLKLVSVWHYDGMIKGRSRAGGKVICLNHVTDLEKFRSGSGRD